jgi:hypothetical protein
METTIHKKNKAKYKNTTKHQKSAASADESDSWVERGSHVRAREKMVFVVSSCYNVLVGNDGIHFPSKSIWSTKIPLRAAFSVWSATLGKILTMDNLRKRHVIVVDRCCMCKSNGKFVNHLLHCEVAYALWNVFFSRFGLSLVMPSRVVNLFACW